MLHHSDIIGLQAGSGLLHGCYRDTGTGSLGLGNCPVRRVRTQKTPGLEGRKEVREADIGRDADQWSSEPGTESIHGGTGLKASNELRLRSEDWGDRRAISPPASLARKRLGIGALSLLLGKKKTYGEQLSRMFLLGTMSTSRQHS